MNCNQQEGGDEKNRVRDDRCHDRIGRLGRVGYVSVVHDEVAGMTKQLTIVSGLGRCGSSMVMKMLINSGMTPTGNASAPLWQDGRVLQRLPERGSWLDGCSGKVIKILVPHRQSPPQFGNYRWIWINRDPVEQEKSQHKMVEWMSVKGMECGRLPHDIAEWTELGLAAIKKAGGPLLVLQFEDIIANPIMEALKIELFMDYEVNPAALAAVVDERGPGCLDYMAEGPFVRGPPEGGLVLPGMPQWALPEGKVS